jgi:predicted kinase
MSEPILHLVCGKIAAGKSTLVARLGAESHTITVSEDPWLASLYPGEQSSLADYLRNSTRLRSAIAPHLVALLRAGLSVVLDFPANTLASRAWMRTLFEEAEVAHQLHWLDVPDEVCKARLRQRNAAGQHEFTVSDEIFDLFTSHFLPPTPEEGFDLVVYRP